MSTNQHQLIKECTENAGRAAADRNISAFAYEQFRRYLSDRCGITLGANKHYLVANRLKRVQEKSGFPSLDALVSRLGAGQVASGIVLEVIDAMTTNETFWFREAAHFSALSQQVELKMRGGRGPDPFTIWSAACSSGQEPYSISMAIENRGDENNVRIGGPSVQILGTDISESVINMARKGVYTDYEMDRGLNANDRSRYFERCASAWKVKHEIRSRVLFKPFNLLNSYSVLGRFDAIFCRNVLIYFPESVKRDILLRMARAMKPGGRLYLSSTEAMPADIDCFRPVRGVPVRCYEVDE